MMSSQNSIFGNLSSLIPKEDVLRVAAPHLIFWSACSTICIAAGKMIATKAIESVALIAIALFVADVPVIAMGLVSLSYGVRVIVIAFCVKDKNEFCHDPAIKATSNSFKTAKEHPLAVLYGLISLAIALVGLAVLKMSTDTLTSLVGLVLGESAVFFGIFIVKHLNSKYHLPNEYTTSLLKYSACMCIDSVIPFVDAFKWLKINDDI